MLTLRNTWFENGHKFVRWSPDTSGLLKHVKTVLYDQLKPYLSRRCSHIKGHGGVKLSVRYCQRLCNHFGYVARFDVRSYYSSMDHQIILYLLRQYQVTPAVISIVSKYLSLPDHNKSGKGMVAGGALSPLIGALYLMPLDKLMEDLQATTGIRYQRYMDDYVIFAPTRHKLRKAIKQMYAVLDDLKVEVHPKKRFIGTTRRGLIFRFVGEHYNSRLIRVTSMKLKKRYPFDIRGNKNALLTALGLRSKGFFTKYNYLNPNGEDVPVYSDVMALMVGKKQMFLNFIKAMSNNQKYFNDFDQGTPKPEWSSKWISPLDGAAIYTAVTEFKPKQIIEVGSGNSTHFMVRAIIDHKMETKVICIDPSPRIDITGLPIDLKQRVLSIDDLQLIKNLNKDDMLFIDSSHILQQGFDLDIILNRFLPALKPGVILHFHDIFLPYPYPEEWGSFRFNEQNALMGWILSDYLDVIFSSCYAYSNMMNALQGSTLDFFITSRGGGSIWLRKNNKK